MSNCCRILWIAIVIGLGVLYYEITKEFPKPNIPLDTWWGTGKSQKIDTSMRPFKIAINDEVLNTLKVKLSDVSFTPPLEGIDFQYGFNTNTLKKLVDFWRTQYNWREREALLNKYPHFKTNIQGLDIHYVHIKPQVSKNIHVLPMIMVHGWPGSFVEFYKIIPMLTTPRTDYNFVFELILPSIPGYGFSQAAAKPGLGATQIAVIMHNLMDRIGFKKYYVQGGDWGSRIVSAMSTLFPENVLGHHSNLCFLNTLSSNIKSFVGSLFPEWFAGKQNVHKIYPLSEHFFTLLEESGYFHIQATKPDTVGVALRDSPAGLAAYILEKFSTGTNKAWRSAKDGNLQSKFTFTELLDNVMIYYVTGSITTSMRIYAESYSWDHLSLNMDRVPTIVPTACAKFPHEIAYKTDFQLAEKYKTLLQSTIMPRGGHFAALEEPLLLAEDIFSAVKKFIDHHSKKDSKNQENRDL